MITFISSTYIHINIINKKFYDYQGLKNYKNI